MKRASQLIRAFTLTEFLIVVAILAVLISMLLPAIKSSIEQASVLQCTQNLRGNQMMLSLYMDDNSSKIHCRPVGNVGTANQFYLYYQPYTDKSQRRFQDIETGHLTCPSTPADKSHYMIDPYTEGGASGYYFSFHAQYYFNGLATRMPAGPPELLANRPTHIIKSPDAFVTWHEGHNPSYGAGPYDDYRVRASSYPGSPYGPFWAYLWDMRWAHHAKPGEPHTSVMAFLDGHARAVEFEHYKELVRRNEIVWSVNR